MSQELGAIISTYVGVYKQTMSGIREIEKLRDPRIIPVKRIMETLDPMKMKLADFPTIDKIMAKLADVTDISASLARMVQDETLTAGECLTVGCVIEHLYMLDEVIPRHLEVDPVLSKEDVAQVFCPQLAKRLSEAVMFNGKLVDRSMEILHNAGISVVYDTINKRLDVNTPNNMHLSLEVYDVR